jgi:diguanylate cyclase (GGDEF)-like protein
MSEATPQIGEATSATDRLMEETWEVRARRASRRELVVETGAGALFLAASVALLALAGAPAVDWVAAGLLLALYAGMARIEFPIGSGHVVPTQLVLVPMLVVLPPALVPLLVAAGLVVSTALDVKLGRVQARRIISAVPDAWHAFGPALVLVAAGSPELGFQQLGLLIGGFAACCLVDLASSTMRMRLAGIAPDFRLHLRVIVEIWAVDACLAPLGFLAAQATEHGLSSVGFVIPLAILLWLLARDRNQRIEQARHRLQLVQRERARLQSAVRRLGDAFASKLDLDALMNILLRGSIEALDAGAGELELSGGTARRFAAATTDELAPIFAAVSHMAADCDEPQQLQHEGAWALALPFTVAVLPKPVRGQLRLVRHERDFESDELELLSELVGKAQAAASDILAHEALREQAITDPLTGLGNRRRLSGDLAAWLEGAGRANPALLLLFDLDGFKAYNDTFGHLAGDALLSRLGAKLADSVAPGGAAYRLGGDEFCALVHVDDAELEDIIARAATALTERGRHFEIGASFGAVVVPHEADSPDHALQLADERMYANKRGRAAGPRDQARDVLMRTMQAKQPDLDEHSSEVANLALAVARRLGLTGEQLDEIARAAELHDVGKVGIPDAILNKPAALNRDEWDFMHQHTILGERILNAAPALRPVARLVRSSHERWDGTGYPDGLAGEAIPLGSRIVAVCDAYEAMTSDRPYRNSLGHAHACRELRAMAGAQFDPAVVECFLETIENSDPAPGLESSPIREVTDHIRALIGGSAGEVRLAELAIADLRGDTLPAA